MLYNFLPCRLHDMRAVVIRTSLMFLLVHSQFTWKAKDSYYYPSIDAKLKDMLEDTSCSNNMEIVRNSSIVLPSSKSKVTVSEFPPSERVIEFWQRKIKKPSQMRLEPELCLKPWQKSKPIFRNPGCQLPKYMHPSAPRCQTSYLHWACVQGSIEKNDSSLNYFSLPEADHSRSSNFFPPMPFLIVARSSFVTMCGQIVHRCGLIHPTASCQAQNERIEGFKMFEKCNVKKFEKKKKMDNGDIITCKQNNPYSDKVVYHEKIFIASEVDDTHVYHIHLGKGLWARVRD